MNEWMDGEEGRKDEDGKDGWVKKEIWRVDESKGEDEGKEVRTMN